MTIVLATGGISRWGSTTDRNLFEFDSRNELAQYLQAVDEIQRTIDSADSADERKEAESLIRIAMSRLANEFRNILIVNAKLGSSLNPNSNTESTTMTDSASTNYDVYEDDYANCNTKSKEAIHDLRSIALRMNSSGYLHDCLKVYVHERKSVIDACFQCLNREKLSRNSARRLEWGVLESKIKSWIIGAKIYFKYYFEDEKRLCEQIFHDLGNNTADACFMDTVRDHTVRLLDTAEALSCIRPAFRTLFKILDLHDTLSGLLPSINKLFHARSSETKAATQILPKLADAVKEILLMFENSLVNEQFSVVRADPIDCLPKYVMHYVYELCDHKQTLMGLSLSDPPSTDAAGTSTESLGFEGQSQFSIHVVWIIASLVSNLEVKAKARLREGPSASCFFAMNNINYIVQKIKKRLELRKMVGDDKFNKLIKKFEQAKADYLTSTFEVVLNCLRDEGLKKSGIFPSRVSKMADRLKRFNGEFKKLHGDLAKLVVPDFRLALELRESVVERLVPAYTSFLLHTKRVHRLENYVEYFAEDLQTAIQDFFNGRGAFFSLSAIRAGPVVWDLNRRLSSLSFSCRVEIKSIIGVTCTSRYLRSIGLSHLTFQRFHFVLYSVGRRCDSWPSHIA